MRTLKLGTRGPTVSSLGLGCMGMSGMYGPSDRQESLATLHAAVDAGITLIDTGDFYGMGHNEMLIGEALRDIARDRVLLSVKFGALRDTAGGWLMPRRSVKRLSEYVKSLGIVLGGEGDAITTLSGGNQQKVIIGRWLASEPRILLLNDPTRGIDINAKRDLYKLLTQLASEGLAVVMLSTELDEHIELMDRVLVFREQELVAEIGRSGLTRHALLGSFFGEDGANGAKAEKGGDLDVAGDRSAG